MSKTFKAKCFDLISQHLKMKQIAMWMVVVFILAIIGLAFLPWQQTAIGHGKVIALSPNEREQKIIAPISGRLEKWYVQDGSYVKKGAFVVKLLDIDPELMSRLINEKQAVLLRLEAAKAAFATSSINVKRQNKLFEEGISSRRKFEESKFEQIRYQSIVAEVKIELAKINVRIARQQSQLVKAPLAGTILRRMPGQESVLVKQGDVLAVLIPDTKSRAVALWLDGNDITLIRKGQQVRLQFEGWPAIQFSGWPSVAVGTFGGRVAFIDPVDNGRGEFRILVTPSPKDSWVEPKYLRQGVRANGWVLLNRVHLWFELWRKFNGFPPTVSRPDDSRK